VLVLVYGGTLLHQFEHDGTVLETNHRHTVHVCNVQNIKTVSAAMQRNPRKSTRKAGGYPADLCNEF
jgi:hypothetical protein